MCVQVPMEVVVSSGVGFPGAGGIDSCEPLDGCREVNVHTLCKARDPNC